MNKLTSLAAELTQAGIVVIKVTPSEDPELFDHEVELEKGFYLQVSSCGKPILGRSEGETHTLFLVAPKTRAALIAQIKSEVSK